jgi:hypothetical protein
MFTFPTSILTEYSFFFADTWTFHRKSGENVYVLIIAAPAAMADWMRYYLVSAENFVKWNGDNLQILSAISLWTEILVVGNDGDVLRGGAHRSVYTFAGQSHTSRKMNCFREDIVQVPVPALVESTIDVSTNTTGDSSDEDEEEPKEAEESATEDESKEVDEKKEAETVDLPAVFATAATI